MRSLLTAAAAVCAVTSAASASTWDFSLASTGEDVFWVSPTNVNPAAPAYDASYEITSVVATISVFGAPVDVEAIDQIPVELRTGSAVIGGPAPVVLFDQFIVAPEPPEAASIAADVLIELDAMGFARASAINLVFGTVTTEVPPFGTFTVPLEGVSFMGTITFTERATGPEDLNNDGVVDASDLAVVLAAWGPCPVAPPCPADFNNDGVVDASDLASLLAAWG